MTVFRTFLSTLAAWWRDGCRVAPLLTRLPLPEADPAGGPLAEAARAFPLAGLGAGAVAGTALYVASALGLSAAAAAVVGLAALTALTGAAGEDGLARVADGFGGGHGAAEKLDIMADGRAGTYGVVALVLGLGLRAAALASMSEPGTAALALTAAAAGSRAAMVPVMARLAPVRTDGAAAAGRPSPEAERAAVLVGGALALVLLGPAAGIVAAAMAAAAAAGVAALARRQVGGHSGDVLAAVQQAAEIAALTAVAASVP